MLVLSRREGQSIMIGNDIVVTVIEIRGEHVRIGIDAPRSITVHREEVATEIRSANKAARVSADFDASALPQPPRPAKSGSTKRKPPA